MGKGGDLLVENLLLINQHGDYQELRDFCSNITIYEQIGEPFLTGHLSIVDGRDHIKNYRITGQESITLKIITPNENGEFVKDSYGNMSGKSIDKTFRVFAITDVNRKNDATQVTASYVLHFIDPMWFEAQRIRVNQVFHGSYSGILYKLLLEHAGFKDVPTTGPLASPGEIEAWEESSPDNNQFISPNWNINKLIKFCVENADAVGNTTWKNSMFYYQCLAGKSRFESFQTMVSRQLPRSFVYQGIADVDYSDIDDINRPSVDDIEPDGTSSYPLAQNIPILHISATQRANTMNGVTGGSYASTMNTYDPVRKVHEETVYSINDVFDRDTTGLGTGHTSKTPTIVPDEPLIIHRLENPLVVGTAEDEQPEITQFMNHLPAGNSYDDFVIHKVNMTNSFSDEDKLIDASNNKKIQQQVGQEYRDTSTMERRALLNILKQNVTEFSIPFRTDLTVGSMGRFFMPTPEPGDNNPDKLQDEYYLVSKMVYVINPSANSGIIKIHGVKDSYGIDIRDFQPLAVEPKEDVDGGSE